jgi:hypothetical protein
MTPREPDRIDLSSLTGTTPAGRPTRRRFADELAKHGHTPAAEQPGPRRWLGIHFACCGVYARIYKHPTKPRYEGHCPRCNAPLSVPIGEGGTPQRFFEAR